MPMPIRDATDVNTLLRWISGENTYHSDSNLRVSAEDVIAAGRRLAAKAYKSLGAGITPGQVTVELGPASAAEPAVDDKSALDKITALMSGQEWDSDTTSAIAEIIRLTDRTIADFPDDADGEDS